MKARKSNVESIAGAWSGRGWDPRYLGYFDCFNHQRFYEAHDVLEDLWLERRQAPEGDFYKALIQLAGAFVHLQKNRLEPAAALLRRARSYLRRYSTEEGGIAVEEVMDLAGWWLAELEGGRFQVNPLHRHPPPRLGWPGARSGGEGSST